MAYGSHSFSRATSISHGKRDNLDEFLREVADAPDSDLAGARVERETDRIDLLVSNGRRAVVIENKIWAVDQDRQFERYRYTLVDREYEAIRLVYHTLDGHQPDPKSLGKIPLPRVKLASYRDDLQGWLVGCQRRAFGETGLREVIGQYIQLTRKMTGCVGPFTRVRRRARIARLARRSSRSARWYCRT